MYRLFAISYSNRNAAHAQTKAAAGGTVLLVSTDCANACKQAEAVLSRDCLISGAGEAQYVFCQDEDLQIVPPLGRTA
jgi:hypothetical protein